MILKALPRLGPCPVHKEAVAPMHSDYGHEHLTDEAKGDHPGKKAYSKSQRPQKLCPDDQQSQPHRNPRPREGRQCRLEPLAPKPPEGLLRPMGKHDHRQGEPQEQTRDAAVSVQELSQHGLWPLSLWLRVLCAAHSALRADF